MLPALALPETREDLTLETEMVTDMKADATDDPDRALLAALESTVTMGTTLGIIATGITGITEIGTTGTTETIVDRETNVVAILATVALVEAEAPEATVEGMKFGLVSSLPGFILSQ